MKDMMRYNSYYGSVHYSDDDKIFYGKVEFILALVSYEGTNVKSLRKAFEEAVDDYLQTCKEQRREPEQPFKGPFDIRVVEPAPAHCVRGDEKRVTLNRYIVDVLEKETGKQKTA